MFKRIIGLSDETLLNIHDNKENDDDKKKTITNNDNHKKNNNTISITI